ncbi:uncharacterized protein LOC111863125 [Cryptotermes secundus]|uniref:uncharacterized protein LOC111863125 n=1 Tax=Cryptotermes secundus TaxID=105785 RepID=UPI001454C570|nr:uncharacterized protein LOC111863125 [Cryptotermes secundus]
MDWSCHQNNENSFRSISKLTANDITSDMRNCAQADVNLDTGNLIFAYTKLNQQFKKMEPKTCHTTHAEIINSGMNYNSIISSVPNNRAALLKNPLNHSKNKQSLKVIQNVPDIYDSVPVNSHTYERQQFSPQLSKFSMYGNASHQNIMGIGGSSVDIFPDYLQQIFIKADTDIVSLYKFLEIFNNSVNSQYVLDSGSCKAHTVLCLSNIPDVSASEDHSAQSETFGKLEDKITVISSYCNDLVENRGRIMINNTNLSATWQRKSLQTVNMLWSTMPPNLHNKEASLYTSHRSCFNASYTWKEGDRCEILKTHNSISKNSQIQAHCIINGNPENLQKHSSMLGDCTSFNERNIEVNFFQGCDISDRKVIHKDSVPFKPGVALQKCVVTAESEMSASLEQYSFETDASVPSDIKKQKKLMDAESLYDLHDFITEGTDKTKTSSRGHPIIMSQKIRSLSQPSLPTFLLHNSTDDEQLSEDAEDGSDSLSDTFTACEEVHYENISKLMEHPTEDIKENKQIEMPCNSVNVVYHETTEETAVVDSNQNVYMVQSDHLDTSVATELNTNVCFSELCNKSQKLQTKSDGFCEENKLYYPSPSEMNTSYNDYEVPLVIIQDMNPWYREDGNALEMESHNSHSITGIEAHVNKRAYPRKTKQHIIFPLSQNEIFSGSKVIPDRNIQCEACILPHISSWNRPENKTCTEEAKTSHSHVTHSTCINYTRDANVQGKMCALTLPSDTDANRRQIVKTSQKYKPQVEICHITETDSKINSKHESFMIRGNISSPEYVSTQRTQMFTRPYSSDIMCSNDFSHQHLPVEDYTAFPKSDAESVSNSWEDSYQTQPVQYPCTQNRRSPSHMSQVRNTSLENALHSCIDMAVRKHENDIHKQPCYTEGQSTQDVTVQTNIRSLINLENQSYCFLCFSNKSNQFNNQNLTLKRHIEALYLESVSLPKKRRYDTLKSAESHISELPTNHNSRAEKSEIIEGFSTDDNEDTNFKYEEYLPKVQDTSIINVENFVDSDHKVPDTVKDISWTDVDVNQKELYMTDQIMKAPTKGEQNFEYQFPKAWTSNIEEKALQNHVPVRRSIRIGLSRRAQPQPLHPHYPQQ